ncbi:MAG: HDIG domain-containing protein [Fimbriimonadaceae bacterium]|nr:HDIG domain-containing protein [Fimbriimonadaceae bacterium]
MVAAAQQALATALAGTKWQGRVFLVGGAVRDELLGKPLPDDLDYMVEGDALGLAAELFQSGVASNEPVVYPRFGTAMVMVHGTRIELATARKDNYEPNSRKPVVEAGTREEDARRRDFTVNALFRDVVTGELLDPTGRGIGDLGSRILRTPSDPVLTLRDDPLRALRAIRFKYQLGFAYDSALREAIVQESERLKIISHERIRDELNKIMTLDDADEAWQDLFDFGLLQIFAPELAAMVGVTQGDYHDADVWHHSRKALRNTAGQANFIRWAAWLHDIGKPLTRTVQKGRIRFFGHETVGANMAADLLQRLKFSQREIAPIATLVRQHMRFMGVPQITPTVARRLVRDVGELVEPLLAVCDADAGALKVGVRRFDPQTVRDAISALGEPPSQVGFDSPLSGAEIMEITKLPEGPMVGQVKTWLGELVVRGELPPGDLESAKNRLKSAMRNATEWRLITSEEKSDE